MTLLDRLFRPRKPAPPVVAEPAPEPEIVQETRSPREAVYREATVIYDSGYRRKGVVMDYNATGVRVRFPTNERLPDAIILSAKSVNLNGPARVVWQRGSEAGLTMTGD